ncbi:hypothetical protein L1276_004752 [Flavobacterium sp. HSC-32F16]|uniref:DUF2683 family protein n=1 Tax=Flavobacterium sp. HSC-32F16 TaxID=2910964 RepID=UPI0020A24799|nr:DUF2683 family protein [Flavobacterium sp. HSC-32F16]MCP2029565.1 hypothetical protein [Flavobacterium sp. HSC-32F16]
MTTIKINERTKTGKAFMAMFEAFFKGVDGIEIIETDSKKEKESPYNPEFVDMVLKSAKSKNSTEINPKDVWGSLGLK